MAIVKRYDYAQDLFMRLVQVDSVSFNEKNVIDYIINEVEKLGIKCQIIRQPIKMSDLDEDTFNRLTKEKQEKSTEQLQIVIEGNDSTKEPIFFCAHIDTVEPGVGIKPIIVDDKIKSDGTTILGSDDKSGVAAMIAAVKYVTENKLKHGKIVLLFDALEEEGLLGARFVDINKFGVKYGFVLDTFGSVGGIVERVQHSKSFTIDLEVKDIPGHAKACLVDNALTIASEIISKLPRGLWDADDYTFSQVVKLVTSNEPGYMVPNKATITCSLRSFVKAELDLLVKMYETFVNKLSYTNTTITYKTSPIKTMGYNHAETETGKMMLAKAEVIFNEMGIPCRHIVNGLGGHDASIFTLKGVPTLVLSCGMMDYHTVNEWIYIEDIHNATHTIIKFIEKA